jgi:hypothetical protein
LTRPVTPRPVPSIRWVYVLRMALVFKEKGGCTMAQAIDVAVACFPPSPDELMAGCTPEQVAENEMEYWGAD